MQQRQVAPERGHDPDARVLVAEAGVNVHAADEGAAHGLLVHGRESAGSARRAWAPAPATRQRGGWRRPTPGRRVPPPPR